MNRRQGKVREVSAQYRAELAEAADVPKGYKRTEVGVIPEDWECMPLRKGISLLSGHHVLAQHCNTSGYGMPYLTGPADFPNGTIQQQKFTDRPTTICKSGDILVTVKGSGSGMLIVADAPYCISRQLMAIRSEEWNSEFLFYTLLQNASKIKAASTGLIPGLSRSDILDQQIPIPSKPTEQRAIATALSDVDALVAALDKLIAKKRAIKTAAMQQLLTGKQRLPGFTGEWEVKRLGEVADLKHGYAFKSETYSDRGKYKVITISNVHDGALNMDEYNKIETLPSDIQNHQILRQGDILMSLTGNVGRVCRISVEGCVLNQRVGLLSPSIADNSFIYHALREEGFSRRMMLAAKGGAQGNLSKADVINYKVMVPVDTEEQTAIAQILSDMDAEIAALEKRLAKTRAIKQGMMQELLTGRTRLVTLEEAESA